jgi:hypothetical protein
LAVAGVALAAVVVLWALMPETKPAGPLPGFGSAVPHRA